MRARATVFAIPKPPPRRSAKAATVRSSPFCTRGTRSPTRSASASTSDPRGAACSPSVSACPFPRPGSLTTRAPARSASSAVASLEPSSATITSASGNCSLSAVTVMPIVPSSARAATRTAAGSATRLRLDRRDDPVVGVGLEAIVPGRAAGEEEREGESSRRRVHVVHGRHPVLAPGRYGRPAYARRLDPDYRDRRVSKSRVDAGEERRSRAALRADRAGDATAVDRPAEAPGLLLDELRRESVPGRCVPAVHELVCELAAEVVEARSLVLGELAVEVAVEVRRVDRDLEGAEPHRSGPAGVGDRLLDLLHDPCVDRADEQHRDTLPVEPVRDQHRIRVLDERA